MDELDAGLYEELITERIRQRIGELQGRGLESVEEPVDQVEAPDVLARHVGETIARVLEQVTGDRVSVANEFLTLARERARDSGLVHLIEPGPHELEAVFPTALHERRPYRRPEIPLGRTDLLMNARGEPSLAHEIGAELTSADRVDLLCAFVKWTGMRLILEPLTEVLERGVPIRVITTTYMGATERRALDELAARAPRCASATTRCAPACTRKRGSSIGAAVSTPRTSGPRISRYPPCSMGSSGTFASRTPRTAP